MKSRVVLEIDSKIPTAVYVIGSFQNVYPCDNVWGCKIKCVFDPVRPDYLV